jgi:hypothetical protein
LGEEKTGREQNELEVISDAEIGGIDVVHTRVSNSQDQALIPLRRVNRQMKPMHMKVLPKQR